MSIMSPCGITKSIWNKEFLLRVLRVANSPTYSGYPTIMCKYRREDYEPDAKWIDVKSEAEVNMFPDLNSPTVDIDGVIVDIKAAHLSFIKGPIPDAPNYGCRVGPTHYMHLSPNILDQLRVPVGEATSNNQYRVFKHPYGKLDIDLSPYVMHITQPRYLQLIAAQGIVESGFRRPRRDYVLLEEILLHRAMKAEANPNLLMTDSPHVGFIFKPRRNLLDTELQVAQRDGTGAIIMSLDKLVEKYPESIFVTPSGVIVMSHGTEPVSE